MARASLQKQGLAPQRGAKTVPQECPIPSGRCATRWQFKLTRARSCTTGARWSCDEYRNKVFSSSPQEQSLLVWARKIQEQQAVVRWRLGEEELLSNQDQRRYWMNWVQSSLLIYPTELEELHSGQLLVLLVAEWLVHRRAELVAGRHQVGAVFSAIAGKRWKSYSVYEVNGHAKLVWRQK